MPICLGKETDHVPNVLWTNLNMPLMEIDLSWRHHNLFDSSFAVKFNLFDSLLVIVLGSQKLFFQFLILGCLLQLPTVVIGVLRVVDVECNVLCSWCLKHPGDSFVCLSSRFSATSFSYFLVVVKLVLEQMCYVNKALLII